MARRRIVTFQDLRRALLHRYVEKSCTSDERYLIEIMRFEDEDFNVECMLMLGEDDVPE
ncbi:hypothetical protein G7B40_042165 [Aetokthonos hydrillicola Thurmond2011]|uniref:Uncharacterized protein n=1 Tax=Aetokthonos hydrillicola Thurmond2011 TaxID=2712845 RepID=A0AAP5MD59_9CYAN|nr:hypothetical protein [Aetokthonos hydrillicola]MDR9900980.1 hypothetical protein [Aetokthonos hydrillicola Thurmond2011]